MKKGETVSIHKMEQILGENLEGKISDAGKVIQNSHGISDDYIGDIRLFQTFARNSLLSAYKYMGLCEYQKKINRHPRKANKVFLISQLHTSRDYSQEFNQSFAAMIARKYIFDTGDMPIVPHLYFPAFLADESYERDYAIEAGHMIMKICDSILVAVISNNVSVGMAEDINYATHELGLSPSYVHFSKSQALKLVGEWEQERHETAKRAYKYR